MRFHHRKVLYASLFFVVFLSVRGAVGGPIVLAGASRPQAASYEKRSILGSHVIYVSPEPGALYVTPASDIIIRSDDKLNANVIGQNGHFDVTGISSGRHNGRVILSDDRRTILFKPDMPFTLGESVNVSLTHGFLAVDGDSIDLNPFTFVVSKSDLNSDENLISRINYDGRPAPAAAMQRESIGAPSNTTVKNSYLVEASPTPPPDLPRVTVARSDSPSSGFLFLSDFNMSGMNSPGNYLMILDNKGNPVYYNKVGWPMDLNLQPTGVVTYFDEYANMYYVMNSSLKITGTLTCGNGYVEDPHELRVLPDGHYFLLCDDYETVDMSSIVPGGNPAATVIGNIIQELDKNGNVVFQWRSWDHFNITDAIAQNLQAANIDYVHANAIEIDPDGNILLSSRHLSEITKINVQTGDIIWRLGGKNNQFTFVNDSIGFSFQHAVRRLSNGDITLFDNGDLHSPQFSRGVEYKLDEVNKTATLVWQYRHSPDVFGSALGYVQRLANGNTLIGWGDANTTLTEVKPDGSTALEMSFPEYCYSYRVYRYPFLIFESPAATDAIKTKSPVTIRWNSSGVDSVNVDYSTDGGSTWINIVENYVADADSVVWSVPDMSASSCEFRITESGKSDMGILFTSDSISVVKSVPPMIGDVSGNGHVTAFDASLVLSYVVGDTTLSAASLAVADVSGDGTVSAYDASLILRYVAGDSSVYQYFKSGTTKGRRLAVSSTNSSGTISVGEPSFDVSGGVSLPIELTHALNVYSVEMTMTLGRSASIQDVSGNLPQDWLLTYHAGEGVLKIAMAGTKPLPPGVVATMKLKLADKSGKAEVAGSAVINENDAQTLTPIEVASIPTEYGLDQNYPNPFNPSTVISYQLPAVSNVVLKIYDVLGRDVGTLVDGQQNAGAYKVNFDGSRYPSGMYFYSIDAVGENGKRYVAIRKLMLMK